MPNSKTIICIGAMLWDVIGRADMRIKLGDDLPGAISQRPGGVAMNVALALAVQGLEPVILSAVGRDPAGEALVARARQCGVDCDMLHHAALRTDSYLAIEDQDQLVASIADAHALETAGEAILLPLRDGRIGSAQSPWAGRIILDSNPGPDVVAQFRDDPCLTSAELLVVPASPAKAARLAPLLRRPHTTFYLNRAEAEVLAGCSSNSAIDAAEAVLALGAARVIVTDGPNSLAEAILDGPTLSLTPPPVTLLRVTGAGDHLLAAHLKALIGGAPRAEALQHALRSTTAYVSGKDNP
ncbi:PfkB family carbohydrate kinase [Paracoccus sp. (in: a-proteobacteria)]|uniref:PfkB family carbohydrate kinase n=1 Tax=Paracoccus sp. TaxID=267 RepID=UPI00289CE78A|nr:PfkB family carbohydrate kinase [Paracoccus sp. (in: a-proteobacteria)]